MINKIRSTFEDSQDNDWHFVIVEELTFKYRWENKKSGLVRISGLPWDDGPLAKIPFLRTLFKKWSENGTTFERCYEEKDILDLIKKILGTKNNFNAKMNLNYHRTWDPDPKNPLSKWMP
jgi:hypothetical protein